MLLTQFVDLSKSAQKKELVRVNAAYGIKVATSGNKAANKAAYAKAIQLHPKIEEEVQSDSAGDDDDDASETAGANVAKILAAVPGKHPLPENVVQALKCLDFPFRYPAEVPIDDLNDYLLPLSVLAEAFRSSIQRCTLTSDPSDNDLVLAHDLVSNWEAMKVPREAEHLFLAWGLDAVADNRPLLQGHDWLWRLELSIELVSEAIQRAYTLWQQGAPEPSPEEAIWKDDFSLRERKQLRGYINAEMNQYEGEWKSGELGDEHMAWIETLVAEGTFPCPKGKSPRVVRAIILDILAHRRARTKEKEMRAAKRTAEVDDGQSKRRKKEVRSADFVVDSDSQEEEEEE